MNKSKPGYINLFEANELNNRVKLLKERLKECIICPHHGKINRLENKQGFCRAGNDIVIASYGPHYGEEDVLVGRNGSGTVFFSYCTLQCVFCQNCDISYFGEGYEVSPERLAFIMVGLQERGCHNINLVSPTHFVPQIIEALSLAVPKGLIIPLVYNTSGYEDTDTLRLLEGIIDIYMPDIKFGDNIIAKKYTKSSHYFDVAREAVKEMYRQVGDLQVDNQGITYRGLLVRHLVMPNNLASTDKVLKFIAEEISCDTLVNLMSQDYPAHKSYAFSELSRGITRYEYAQAVEQAQQFGLTRLITSSELNF